MPAFCFPFQRPDFPTPDIWLPHLQSSYAQHWFSNNGPAVLALEKTLTDYFGRPTILTSNGTDAITIALLALPRPGPVLLPSFTFPATLMAVRLAGCEPVVIDVDPVTWELSIATVAAALDNLTEPPVAVLSVRCFGLCRDQRPLERFLAERGIPLLIDAAASLGGKASPDVLAGQQGLAECFSLHATKVFAVGEGGVLVGDADLLSRARAAGNFALREGIPQGWGCNAKMSEFHAAIGLAQWQRLPNALARRQQLACHYADFFKVRLGQFGWQIPALDVVQSSPWQAFPLLLATNSERQVIEERLAAVGIQTRRYYTPSLHQLALSGMRTVVPCPVAESLAERMLCLPMYSDMTTEEELELFDRLGRAI